MAQTISQYADYSLENPNILVPHAEVGVLAQVNVINFTCPHCHHLGAFHNVLDRLLQYSKIVVRDKNKVLVPYYASVRVCPNAECRGLVFVISSPAMATVSVLPPQVIDFDSTDLPAFLLTTLSEAITCHAAGAYRASAMMVRRLLEEICSDNEAKGRDLHARIAALKDKVTLPQALFDAMNELKALGNDAAHVQAKSYDNIGADEAADSIELAKEILKSLYQLNALVARLTGRRSSPQAT